MTFFQEDGFASWFNTDLAIYQLKFDIEYFRDQLYQEHQIHRPERLNKAVKKRLSEYFAGRYCAIQTLNKMGIQLNHIDRGERGDPLWPDGVYGSISHCSNRAVAVAGPIQTELNQLGVGIDIEDEVNEIVIENVRNDTVNPNEVELIFSDPAQVGARFTLMFSIKESFFKAAYLNVGAYFGFDAISLFDIDFATHQIAFKINKTLSPELTAGSVHKGQFKVIDGKQYVTFVELV